MAPQDRKKIANRVAEVIREVHVCGLTIGGELAFCDDKHAPSEVKETSCECKKAARAVLEQTGILNALDELLDTTAHLAAATSLLKRARKTAKRAAPSDKMFDQMLVDYEKARARGAVAWKKVIGK